MSKQLMIKLQDSEIDLFNTILEEADKYFWKGGEHSKLIHTILKTTKNKID